MKSFPGLFRLYWYYEYRRFPMYAVNALVSPLMIVYLGYVIERGPNADIRFWIAAGMMLSYAIASGSLAGLSLMADRFQGRLALVKTTPVTKAVLIATYLTNACIWSLASFLVWMCLLQIQGVRATTPGALVQGILVALTVSASSASVAMAVASRAASAYSGDVLLSLTGIALVYLSPVLYDLHALPAWLRPLAYLSPYTYGAELCRAFVNAQAPPVWAVAGLLATSAVAIAVSARCLKWKA